MGGEEGEEGSGKPQWPELGRDRMVGHGCRERGGHIAGTKDVRVSQEDCPHLRHHSTKDTVIQAFPTWTEPPAEPS